MPAGHISVAGRAQIILPAICVAVERARCWSYTENGGSCDRTTYWNAYIRTALWFFSFCKRVPLSTTSWMYFFVCSAQSTHHIKITRCWLRYSICVCRLKLGATIKYLMITLWAVRWFRFERKRPQLFGMLFLLTESNCSLFFIGIGVNEQFVD